MASSCRWGRRRILSDISQMYPRLAAGGYFPISRNLSLQRADVGLLVTFQSRHCGPEIFQMWSRPVIENVITMLRHKQSLYRCRICFQPDIGRADVCLSLDSRSIYFSSPTSWTSPFRVIWSRSLESIKFMEELRHNRSSWVAKVTWRGSPDRKYLCVCTI